VKNVITSKYKLLFVISFGLLLLLLIVIGQSNIAAISSKKDKSSNIKLYYISTREFGVFNNIDPLAPNYNSIVNPGYGNDTYQNISQLKGEQACKNGTVAIFVHGWEESEKNVQERLNRLKLSLAQDGYIGPLVGFSWGSDTVWLGAQFIAQANGPKLAKLIYDITNDCPNVKIRIIAHSLGARVVLSALDSLHQNPLWTGNNSKIASIHLMGAAVDDEEVSNRTEFILNDQTNWGSPKSAYGRAIQGEVINFYNLFSSEDNMLEPFPQPPSVPVYPTFERDFALGQSGYQKYPLYPKLDLFYNLFKRNSLPKNYNETNVTGELIAICDADADKHPDKPFIEDQTIKIGDNHKGYLGYRNATNNTTIIDDGAIDIVVDNWNNIKPTSNINPKFNSSSICHDTSNSDSA
jgi:pimeloyl-ACP methyl ester carboxylesterase